MAPMVHWPEVTSDYDNFDKVLFSCQTLLESLELWIKRSHGRKEARRYYFNIVGKYGPQVQAVLKRRQIWKFSRFVLFIMDQC